MHITDLATQKESLNFAPGTDNGTLDDAEFALSVPLPSELRNFLSESNGLMGKYSLALVWPIERIVADNLAFRQNPEFMELYMPFDSLLFFADAGNGDQFAYSLNGGKIRRTDIFVWDHETDSRNWVAPCLLRYVEWWLNGQIKV